MSSMPRRFETTAPGRKGRAPAARRGFLRDTRGAMTLWLLVWSIVFLAFAGLAIDLSNMYRTRAMLQATADAAVHAALVKMRDGASAADARTAAQDLARANLPRSLYGEVVDLVNVEIGAWDGKKITTGGPVADAVKISARRVESGDNAVPTTFLSVIGIFDVDVSVEAVGVMQYPPCPNDGIFARKRLKFTAQNAFGSGLCLHSQQELMISNFDKDAGDPIGNGTIFSAPSWGQFNTSASAWSVMAPDHVQTRNYDPAAATETAVRGRMDRIRDSISGLTSVAAIDLTQIKKNKDKDKGNNGKGGKNGDDGGDASGDTGGDTGGDNGGDATAGGDDGATASEGDDNLNIDLPGGEITIGGRFKRITNPSKNYDLQADIDAGYRYFDIVCTGNGSITLKGETDLSNAIVVSTCGLKTTGGSTLRMYDTVIAVDVPGDKSAIDFKGKSINASAGSCAGYGQVKLLSTGGIKFTADTNFSHIEMVATGEIKLTSKADLTAGVSLQSWDEIDFSAQAKIFGCGAVPNDQTEFAPVLRIAG